MKKFNLNYSLLFVALLVFSGCNDDFLNRSPLDQVSSETFWNTENDLMVYNNNFYNRARNDHNIPILLGHHEGFGSHEVGMLIQDGFTDNLAPHHERNSRYAQVRAGKHNVSGGSQWQGYRGWDFVRSINVGLANYDNADIPQADINKYAGEARLFRGWFYGEKVAKFGDVPWVDRELNIDSEELFAARTPRIEAMDNVLADLDFAAEWMPDDWNDGNAPGRLNRWAALLIKSRVALFEGTFRKYHGLPDSEKFLRAAADAAEELMVDGPYSLYNTGNPDTDYNAYHRMLDLSGNPEVMAWRKYELGVFTNHVQSYYSYTGGATKSMVEDYLDTDGMPITLSNLYEGDDTIEDVFVNRDPRLRQTILHPDDKAVYQYHAGDSHEYPKLLGQSGRTSSTGYHVIKHYMAEDLIGKAYNQGEYPAIILRFAEALLNYAEAREELGELTQNDLDISINLLRDRVNMPHLTLSPPMDPRYADDGISAVLVEIRRERRVELFGEGYRYYDLLRWKQGKKLEEPDLGIHFDAAAEARYDGHEIQTTMVNGRPYVDVYAGTDWADPVFDESKHYLWPIPINEISQNPAIGQNPGWE
ncbi:MAG: RagB/SusD family nutrient uptake outer membrane protein [Balneolales bacterium]